MQLKSAIGGNLERPELRTTLLTSAAVGNLFLLVLVIYFDFCLNSILRRTILYHCQMIFENPYATLPLKWKLFLLSNIYFKI